MCSCFINTNVMTMPPASRVAVTAIDNVIENGLDKILSTFSHNGCFQQPRKCCFAELRRPLVKYDQGW